MYLMYIYNLLQSWIRIRIQVKSRIRILIKSLGSSTSADEVEYGVAVNYEKIGYYRNIIIKMLSIDRTVPFNLSFVSVCADLYRYMP